MSMRLLVVDDEHGERLLELLRREDLWVCGLSPWDKNGARWAASVEKAIELERELKPDVIVLDYVFGIGGSRSTASGFVRYLDKSRRGKDYPYVILISGKIGREETAEALSWLDNGRIAKIVPKSLGAFELFEGALFAEIREHVRHVWDRAELEKLLRSQYQPVLLRWKICTVSENMSHLVTDIGRASRQRAPVLVLGETGTGKELVAEAIHENSPRRDKPFVSVNIAAVPDTLIESELFGSRVGAFTGARTKRGTFEEAEGGTLFLDEVGEMSSEMQSKLLRAIELGEIKPVGEGRSRTIDVRIISATNKDLMKEVEEGRFREDLYYRLDVLRIHLPPLRERKQDIVPLIEYIAAGDECKTELKVTQDARVALLEYDWPGNVRQLLNFVEKWNVEYGGSTTTMAHETVNKVLREMARGGPKPSRTAATQAEVQEQIRMLKRDEVIGAITRAIGMVQTGQKPPFDLTKSLSDEVAEAALLDRAEDGLKDSNGEQSVCGAMFKELLEAFVMKVKDEETRPRKPVDLWPHYFRVENIHFYVTILALILRWPNTLTKDQLKCILGREDSHVAEMWRHCQRLIGEQESLIGRRTSGRRLTEYYLNLPTDRTVS